MTYMDGMEAIDHSIMDTVLAAATDYDYYQYTENHVLAALSHDEITLEDFKALLSSCRPASPGSHCPPGKSGDPQAFRQQRGAFYPRCTLPTTAKTTAFTAALTVKTGSTVPV